MLHCRINHINKMWSDSDWRKYDEFLNQLTIAKKILYILFSILIIMGNTLALLATWRAGFHFYNTKLPVLLIIFPHFERNFLHQFL